MPKKSQVKGSNGEKELVGLLWEAGYNNVIQPPQPTYGKRPDVEGLPNIHCEVKRREKLNVYEAFEQSKRDSVKFGDGLPVVFWRKNRRPWLVVMELEDWLKIYGGKTDEYLHD